MSSQWDQATRLFGAARELPPGQRGLYLDHACGSNKDLRAAVESLLCDETPSSFLELLPSTDGETDGWLPSPPLTKGQLLKDRYRIEISLGSGGQAHVYVAVDERLSRRVVVKVMRGLGGANHWLKQRLEREMHALSRIDHPGVVGILDVGELSDGSPFLVIQYISGISLRELLRRGPLPLPFAARVLAQLGSALGAAHAAGVVHSDLKPENVLIHQTAGGDDLVKLIDFGIAKIESSELDPRLTTVTVVGTVRYMAPEQFEGKNVAASDTYAFGRLACELLCGEPDPRCLPGKVGPRVLRLIESALSYRADDRPASIEALSGALASALTSSTYSRRYALVAIGSTALVATGLAVGRLTTSAAGPRIVEKVGAFDPIEEGFRTHNDISGTVVANGAGDGLDAWQVSTARQGHYYRSLSEPQKRRALRKGWTLAARMRVDMGAVFAVIDFAGVGRRYDMVLCRDSDHDFVRIQTQITPTFEGPAFAVAHDNAYHLYELRYDAGAEVAALWIDGRRQATGYRGHTQYQGDGDFVFGAAVYKNSPLGMGAFQSVRFEINP